MRRYTVLSSFILTAILLLCTSVTVFANSSWRWLTTSPLPVLPFAIIFTLLIETIAIVRFGKVKNAKKAFCVITLANLLSFVVPYIMRASADISGGMPFDFVAAFEKGPYFIVLVGYLLLTLFIELPVVFLLLMKNTDKLKHLVVSILISNAVTTAIVAVLERIICVGQW